MEAPAITRTFGAHAVSRSLGRRQQLREAILLIFCEPVSPDFDRVQRVSGREWQGLLYWLDTSGLALYFLDRLTHLGLCEILPPAVLSRLQQDLADNAGRTQSFLTESSAIQLEFREAGLSYAVLKGFSLWPVSVPRPELRSQLDLDFLIAEEDANRARGILEARGYILHATSGRSWEFKTSQTKMTTLKDLYKPTKQCIVELHIESSNAGSRALLPRTETLRFHEVYMPVLPRVDLFLGQGLHLYKHVCSEFFRVAHLIEFRRHIIARYDDDAFWQELRRLAINDPKASVGLGLVTLLISHVMGDFAPEALTCWTVDALPSPLRLWIELYGHRAVFTGFPGSKLYLLLQEQLQQAGLPTKRSLLRALLPLRPPPAINHGAPGETLPQRLRRHHRQGNFILFRLRFHLLEGLRYLIESIRWKRHLSRIKSYSKYTS